MNTEEMVKLAKKYQIDNDLSCKQFAEKCGYTPQGLSNVYSGKYCPNDILLSLINLDLKITQVGKNKTIQYIKRKPQQQKAG